MWKEISIRKFDCKGIYVYNHRICLSDIRLQLCINHPITCQCDSEAAYVFVIVTYDICSMTQLLSLCLADKSTHMHLNISPALLIDVL